MVLRGTKTRPEQADILDIQHHIARLQLLIGSLQEQGSDVQHELNMIIDSEKKEKDGSDALTLDALKSGQHGIYSESMAADVSLSIKVLIDRLEYLENLQKNTKQELTSKQKEFWIMVQQFVCGGFAGMTARSTVAPIDRVKLIIQTAMVRNEVESGQRGIIGRRAPCSRSCSV